MRIATNAVLLGLILLFSQACNYSFSSPAFKAKTTKTATFEYAAGSKLLVKSRNGSVTVTAEPDRIDVLVEATIRCGGMTQQEADDRLANTMLSLSRADDLVLVIEPIYPGGPKNGDGATISVRLPEAAGIQIESSNGAVRITSVDGAFTGELIVNTSNGGIKVVDFDGSAELDTSNGSIEVTGLNGSLSVDTSNGNVHASDIGGSAHIDTSNGSVVVVLRADQSGPLIVDTSNGGINATVGAEFVGVVGLDTSNGRLTISDEAGIIRHRNITKTDGRIVVGEGGEASMLDTSNGNIKFTVVEIDVAAVAE